MQSSRETVDFSVELTLRIIVEIFPRDLDLGHNEIADFYANDQMNWLRCVYNIRIDSFRRIVWIFINLTGEEINFES